MLLGTDAPWQQEQRGGQPVQDFSKARYVQLLRQEGHFTILLFDANRQEMGHGYRGPTWKRAEADLKYWMRDKGLEQIPE
jgi:hypothetical protein